MSGGDPHHHTDRQQHLRGSKHAGAPSAGRRWCLLKEPRTVTRREPSLHGAGGGTNAQDASTLPVLRSCSCSVAGQPNASSPTSTMLGSRWHLGQWGKQAGTWEGEGGGDMRGAS